jgi:hypothetical protein
MNESWQIRKRRKVLFLQLSYLALTATSESDAAAAAKIQPRRVRAWEDPKLREKPPIKTLAEKTGGM